MGAVRVVTALSIALLCCDPSHAGGPLGIDHRINDDDAGIWKRSNQHILQYGVIATVVAGAAWEGGDTRLGRTFWQSIDSTAIGAVSSEGLKRVFSRARPAQTDDPNRWFEGRGYRSFPSGEVTEVAAAVTPFVLEYGHEHPLVYALELLPLYDGIARVKVQAHWQSDVLAGWALGSAVGYFAHGRAQPFSLMVVPRGLAVGFKTQF